MALQDIVRGPAAQVAASGTPALPAQVRKRDGARVPFELTKIASAIARAGAATGEFDADEANALAQAVGRVLAHKHTGGTPDIETIQDCVEHTLAAAGWFHTARAYIVYRDRHERLRADRKTLVDVAASVDEYLEQKDWRVNANANQGYSLGGLILNVSGKVIANYWLSHVYAPEIGRAHREGDVHIHDLDMLAGYCAGWSLRQLLHEGLNGVPGKVEAGPPKHMSSAVGQIVNFLGTLQNEWAGAQAFSSFDTYMAPFVRADAMSYEAVKQSIQELIYNLNVPSRWGTQTPFTNLTFDWICPEDLREQIPVIGGPGNAVHLRRPAARDGHDQPRVHRGDDRGRRQGARVHLPDPDLQHHARFRLGPSELRGAVRDDREVRPAVLPELRELGVEAQHDPVDVLPPAARPARASEARQRPLRLGRADRLARRGHDQLRAPGLPPCRRRDRPLRARRRAAGLRARQPRGEAQGDPAPHRPGPLPVHQALPRHAAQPLLDDRRERHQRDGAQLHARRRRHHDRRTATRSRVRLLDHLRARMLEFQEDTGHMYNLEATPAEGTTYRFAKEDRKRWPDILQAGTAEQPYYTNSSQLPVGFTDDPFEALARQEELQTKYTGGTVLHLYMSERLSSAVGVQGAGAPRAHALPPAVHHRHADVLHLPGARLSRRRARVLPEVRRREARREAAQARGMTSIHEKPRRSP